jgi:hypothetical protein
MSKPILLFVFAKNCSGCINFKKRVLPELEKELSSDSRLTYQIIEFNDMQVTPNEKHHPDLKNGFVRFFPTLMLVPSNLWNNHKSKLKAVVKHGDEDPPKVDYSKVGILAWVNETITKNPLFTGNSEKSFGPLSKSLPDGKHVVPTYGQFRNSKLDESEM